MDNSLKSLSRNQQLQIWSKRVKDCRSSGLSVKTWCSNNGVKTSTYYAWQKRLFQAITRPTEETKWHKSKTEFVEIPRERIQSASNQVLAATIVVGETSVDVYNLVRNYVYLRSKYINSTKNLV